MLTDEFGALAGHLWRRRVLVVLVMLLFGAASWYSARHDDTVYTSSAALTVMSGNRAPDQDAILSQGYAAFFNDGLFQTKLREQAGVPDDVTFEATTGLASPLLYVTATSTNAQHVETAARKMADALRAEVNGAIDGAREEEVQDLKSVFEELSDVSDEVPEQAVVDLNDRIGEITADSSNKLQPVQLNSHVQATDPPATRSLALGLASGLVVGCAVALLLGALSRRIQSVAHLERRTELDVLAELAPVRDPIADAQLWTVLQAEQDAAGALLRASRVIAIASPRQQAQGSDVAMRVAEAAVRTGKTVLIELRHCTDDEPLGFTDWVLNEAISTPRVLRRVAESVWVVGVGRRSADLSATLEGPRALEFIEVLRRDFSTIVLAPPGTLDSADALPACRLADDVVLVVDQGRSRVQDVVKSVHLLSAVVRTPPRLLLVQRGSYLGRQHGPGSDGTTRSTDAVAPVGAPLSRVP